MYVITWSIVSIDISAEDSPTFLQCLTALLSELWTLIFLHNYEKWIFWCSFSACPPGKAHTETQSCYSIGRQFKAVVVLDSLQGLVFECGTLVKNDCARHRNDIDGVYVTLHACRLFLKFTLTLTFLDTSVLWNKIDLCPDHPDGSFFQSHVKNQLRISPDHRMHIASAVRGRRHPDLPLSCHLLLVFLWDPEAFNLRSGCVYRK